MIVRSTGVQPDAQRSMHEDECRCGAEKLSLGLHDIEKYSGRSVNIHGVGHIAGAVSM